MKEVKWQKKKEEKILRNATSALVSDQLSLA